MNEKLEELLLLFNDQAFTNVLKNENYLPLLVTYTKEDAEINGLRKAKASDTVYREPEYFSALETLDRDRTVVYVGEKGMGKSTFLKMLAFCMRGEQVGDNKYTLTKLCEPVVRTDKGEKAEKQEWNAGALIPYWINICQYADGNPSRKNLPAEVDTAQLLLIDGLEDLDEVTWNWFAEQICALRTKRPELYIAAACEADVINRLRPRLRGFTAYTIKPLTDSQKKEATSRIFAKGCLSEKDYAIPIGLNETLSITQNYLTWIEMEKKGKSISSFFNSVVDTYTKDNGYSETEARKQAYAYFSGEKNNTEMQIFFSAMGRNESVLQYLAICHCLANNFGQDFAELIQRTGNESWAFIRMLKCLMRENANTICLHQITDLCPKGEPEEGTCLQALFSTDLLFEIKDRISLEEAFLKNNSKKWMLAIVENGWLSIYDRIIAGNRLSWLGDIRKFDEMVFIPGGRFTMGDYILPNNQPVTEIKMKSYKIGKYPIVNLIYREFIAETGRVWLSEEKDNCERFNHPAVNLTWYDAVAFCDWLTEKWRGEGRISKNELVRLPTEAEWEYAARGKMTSEKGKYCFTWGTVWHDDSCNSQELGLNDTCSVGLFPKNVSAFGCRDMNGMVWEWNSTLWGNNPKEPAFPYPYDPFDGREKSRRMTDDIRRCMRGGSFGSTWDHATCTYRGGLEPIGFWRGDGFRIVVSEVNYND